jgi:hypothetical protein
VTLSSGQRPSAWLRNRAVRLVDTFATAYRTTTAWNLSLLKCARRQYDDIEISDYAHRHTVCLELAWVGAIP